MPNRVTKSGSELFIVDNSDDDWKVLRYLHDWCQISKGIDIATGYFEIGALVGHATAVRPGAEDPQGNPQEAAKHLKSTYLKSVQAPVWVKPALKA